MTNAQFKKLSAEEQRAHVVAETMANLRKFADVLAVESDWMPGPSGTMQLSSSLTVRFKPMQEWTNLEDKWNGFDVKKGE